MELILISKNKLKIMLSDEDMKRYELTTSGIDYDNTETRKAFWEILNEAKQTTGFDAAKDKIFIQLYPSKSGGCEMFVTKLGVFSATDEYQSSPIARAGEKGSLQVRTGKYSHGGRERTGAYRFESLESLLRVCRELYKRRWNGNSSVYKDSENIYYLIIREKGDGIYSECGALDFILEYGTSENPNSIRLYISENGRCFCHFNAVETLGKL
jgi:negative regulator of genetic competence, sporulation and motility